LAASTTAEPPEARASCVILAIETSTPGEAVAVLVRDGAVLDLVQVRDPAQDLAAAVQGLLRNQPRPELAAAIVGPGGFTGIRAGLALLQGFSLARGLPLAAASFGEAVAACLPPTRQQLLVARDARLGRFAVENFGPGSGPRPPLAEPLLLDAAGLRDLVASLSPDILVFSDPLSGGIPGVQALPPAADRARGAALVGWSRARGDLPPRSFLPLYLEPLAARPGPPSRPAPR